jgi:uncharacterized protein (UPF0303 family)
MPTLEEVEAHERELVLSRGDLAFLYRLGSRMADDALARALPLVIQVRLGRRLVFAAALPGSTESNHRWARRKSRIVEHFEQSSMRVRLANERDGEDVGSRHSLPVERYAAHGGAFPLLVAGVGFVGVVVVSGLPQADDHAFVVEHLRSHIAEAGA